MENPHNTQHAAHARLQSLEKRHSQLIEKLNQLQEQHDFETRVEEQLRLANGITQTKFTLAEINSEIADIKIPALIQEANRLKNIKNYQKAIEVWHEVITLQPKHPLAASLISQLETTQKYRLQAAEFIKQLAMHSKPLKPVYKDLMHQLREAKNSIEFQHLIEVTGDYISHKMDAEDYILWYQAAVETQPEPQQTTQDLESIAQRIQAGDMVLFLGSDIAKHYQHDCLNDQEVAEQLAKEVDYTTFNGTLSSIVEYCQSRPEMGANKLLDHLQDHLPKDSQRIGLYHHLAHTKVAQVLITSAYDELLEQAFIAANKPFVKLSSFINKGDRYEMGHVKVHYSDHRYKDQILIADDLSKTKFIEQGYSVIYKIRGTCNKDDIQERDALLLSERQFFDFARDSRSIIPSNLATEIRKRGFLFLGYQPRNWEDRLLVKVLLEKRQKTDESCYVFANHTEPMEEAHWKQYNVERYPFDLSQLDACFQQANESPQGELA